MLSEKISKSKLTLEIVKPLNTILISLGECPFETRRHAPLDETNRSPAPGLGGARRRIGKKPIAALTI